MISKSEYAKTRRKEIKANLIKDNPSIESKYKGAGCYSISIDGKIVYIGESSHLLERVVNHLYQIELKNSKAHMYEVLREAHLKGHKISFDVIYHSPRKREDAIKKDIKKKEGVLIRRYKPPLNYKIPRTEDYNKFNTNKRAGTITLDEILCS